MVTFKQKIVEICRLMYQRGYIASTEGNVSFLTPQGQVIITPSGQNKGFLAPDQLVTIDLDGRKLYSTPRQPSSELPVHLFVYRRRSDVKAVIHAHPPVSTGFAVAGVGLVRCILPEVVLTLGEIPLTKYATPSTEEMSKSLEEHIDCHQAFLLGNHGVLTLGRDLWEAFNRLEMVEQLAKIMVVAKLLGKVTELSPEKVRELLRLKEELFRGEGEPVCQRCGACQGSSSSPTEDRGLVERITQEVLDLLSQAQSGERKRPDEERAGRA